MAVLDSTLAGPASNSYCDLLFANEYAANQSWGSKWDVLTDDEKIISLITATSWMEMLKYTGNRCDLTQRLAWPRANAACDGVLATCAEIPYSIRRTEVELAYQAYLNPDAIIGGGGGASAGTYVKRQKLGSLEVEYDQYDGTSVASCDNCNDPIVITKFPWIKGLIGCWLTGLTGGVGLMLRVRS
mgnify:CR=1 FL=1